eukprot:349687-Chlamydomonas_euryale.AAC.8
MNNCRVSAYRPYSIPATLGQLAHMAGLQPAPCPWARASPPVRVQWHPQLQAAGLALQSCRRGGSCSGPPEDGGPTAKSLLLLLLKRC